MAVGFPMGPSLNHIWIYGPKAIFGQLPTKDIVVLFGPLCQHVSEVHRKCLDGGAPLST